MPPPLLLDELLTIVGGLSPLSFLYRSYRHHNLLGLGCTALATQQREAIQMLRSGKHVEGCRKGQRANSRLQSSPLLIQSIEQWSMAFAP